LCASLKQKRPSLPCLYFLDQRINYGIFRN
jgi:hypothetical protein